MSLPDNPSARNSYILDAVSAGRAQIVWTPLTITASGHTIVLQVTGDAVMVDAVRFGAGARLAQQIADLTGSLLVTPKVMDLMFGARIMTLQPFPLGTQKMMSTDTFIHHSSLIDQAIGNSSRNGIIMTTGKPFCLSNAATAAHGVNYGWHLPLSTPKPWEGIAIYPSVTLTSQVIQQPGTAHSLDQDDYASTVLLMRRDVGVDGAAQDLATVLQDATLGPILSHEGPLKQTRQPGVAMMSPSALAMNNAPGLATLVATALGAVIGHLPGAVAGAVIGTAIDARRRA
jgi:hypothetical protein